MTAKPDTGDMAPDFTLEGDDGAPVALEALRGRNVVVYFYPKDDTSGCTRESIEFSGLKEAFAAANTVVVGISGGSAASKAKFKAKHDLTVALAADPDHATLEAYGVWAEKSMYGRKYFGVERSTFLIGADGRIVRAWRSVKVPGHAEEVLAAARACG